MNVVATFLRKIGLMSPSPEFTGEVVDEAVMENALWDNEQAFKKVTETYKDGSAKANDKLKRAAERIRIGHPNPNPFADLESLTNLTRDIRRRQR